MKNILTDNAIIDTKTGEITQYLTQEELAYLNKKYTTASPTSKINDEDCRKSVGLFNLFISEKFGSFYHNYYGSILNHKYLFRFIYLCTFINYKGYIEFGNATGLGKLATKKDLKEILRLKDQQFYESVNYFIENKMILIIDGYIKINEVYCNRGKIDKNEINKGVVRMFDNAVREIYINSNTKEHEKLGLLIKLLPYVNFKTNAIVSNPKEEREELLKPLKQKELMEILGVTKPTINSLLNITILDGKEFVFIKFSNGAMKNTYIINPRFLYKGNNLSDIEEASLKFFTMGIKKVK